MVLGKQAKLFRQSNAFFNVLRGYKVKRHFDARLKKYNVLAKVTLLTIEMMTNIFLVCQKRDNVAEILILTKFKNANRQADGSIQG